MKKYLPPTLKQTIFLSIKNRYQNSVFSKTSRPSHILPYKTRIHDTTERIFKDRILIPSHVTHSQPTAAHDTPHPLFSQNHCTRSFLSRYYSPHPPGKIPTFRHCYPRQNDCKNPPSTRTAGP